jgi:hypothetical protein
LILSSSFMGEMEMDMDVVMFLLTLPLSRLETGE